MVLLPVAGWLMGRLARAPFPVPAVLAVATVPFMFGTEFAIYGGNIFVHPGRRVCLWLEPVVRPGVPGPGHPGPADGPLPGLGGRAVRLLLHVATSTRPCSPASASSSSSSIYALRNRDWEGAFWWSSPTIVVGGLLAAWWALPFYAAAYEGYVTNMGYQRNTTYLTTLFPDRLTPGCSSWPGWAPCCRIARRRRMGEFLTIMAVLSRIAFRYMPQSILWNARVLPFWFLTLYLLAGLAVAELYAILAERTTGFMVTLRAALLPAPLIVLVLALVWVGFPLRVLPGEERRPAANYSFLGDTAKTIVGDPELDQLELQRLPVLLPGHAWQTATRRCTRPVGLSTSRSSPSW